MDKLDMPLSALTAQRRVTKKKSGGPMRRKRNTGARRFSPYDRKSSPRDLSLDTKKVFVGNLSWETTWQQLKDHMRSVGNVVHADVLKRRDGKSSGAGIVEYESFREAKRAIRELNDTEIDGRNILVREDREGSDGAKRNSSRGGGSDAKRVFVGNLSWDVSWQDLKDHMRKAGNVVHADVLKRRDGKSSGAGIVEYENVRQAKRAIEELTDTDLNGRMIFVREDREGGSSSSGGGSSRGGDSRSRGGRGSNSKRVFVGNLSWDVSWQDLKDHMRKAGDVVHADVLKRRDGKSSGGGIVEYATAREAKNAMAELNDTDLNGRMIFVREDRE